MSMLLDMGPITLDLVSRRTFYPNYGVGQVPLLLKNYTDAMLPLHDSSHEKSNKIHQAYTSTNMIRVNTVKIFIMTNHV